MTTHEFAVEVDTKLAKLYERKLDVEQRLDWIRTSIRHLAGQEQHWLSKTRYCWIAGRDAASPQADFGQAFQAVTKLVREHEGESDYTMIRRGYNLGQARRTLSDYYDYEGTLQTVEEDMAELEMKFRDCGGWSRFFLVNNNRGHIHSSMHCHTCRASTRFVWLPEVSGLTEVEAVAAHGPVLCSVCFPSAPVDWTLSVGEAKKVSK